MEKKLSDYIKWYKEKRKKFCSDIYIDKSSWLKRKLLPYSNWNGPDVIDKETSFIINAIAKLGKSNFEKNIISLASLTLSNRAEYISDQSDFYVIYSGFIIFTSSIISIPLSLELKVIIALFALGGVAYCLTKRLELRQEISMCKEIINIFSQYEQKHA